MFQFRDLVPDILLHAFKGVQGGPAVIVSRTLKHITKHALDGRSIAPAESQRECAFRVRFNAA